MNDILSWLLELLAAADWTAVGTIVTALATVVLAVATTVLFQETKRMRLSSGRATHEAALARQLNERIHDWNVQVHGESKEPHFIIYMDLDEIEDFESIILENVSDNPAYDVSVSFSPDLLLPVYKPGTGNENPHLSEIGLSRFTVVAPRQKVVRTFSVFTDGTGHFDRILSVKDVEVTVSYRLLDGGLRSVILKLDDGHTMKSWFSRRNTLIALQKQIEKSTRELSSGISTAIAQKASSRSPSGIAPRSLQKRLGSRGRRTP